MGLLSGVGSDPSDAIWPLNHSLQRPTLRSVSTTVQRPEVAVVRHPIADGRNNVVGFELRFGGALLRREGPKGELLSAVTAYERGEFPTAQPADAGVSLAGAYRAALEWADEARRAIA
jgi:hypothetical protein